MYCQRPNRRPKTQITMPPASSVCPLVLPITGTEDRSGNFRVASLARAGALIPSRAIDPNHWANFEPMLRAYVGRRLLRKILFIESIPHELIDLLPLAPNGNARCRGVGRLRVQLRGRFSTASPPGRRWEALYLPCLGSMRRWLTDLFATEAFSKDGTW